MKRNILHCSKQALAVTIAVALAGLTACTSRNTLTTPVSPVSKETNYLGLLQQNKGLTGRFYGIITFENAGTTFTFPSEFIVPPVPLDWMGQIFNGKLEESGPGEDVTDQVHGSVSADGTWLVSLVYSRQIIRTINTGTFYRVTLQNVPIVKVVNGVATGLGTFEKAGADIQKHLVKIEYADGVLNGGQIVPATTYLSTDWKNTGNGQIPTLRLAFTKEAPSVPKTGTGM